MAKFYDNIDLSRLALVARGLEYPPLARCLGLQVHMGWRCLRYAGHYSEPIEVSIGIVAGDPRANSFARAVLYEVMEGAHVRFPLIRGRQFVDDMAFTVALGAKALRAN